MMNDERQFVHLTRPLRGEGECEVRRGRPALDADDLGVIRGVGAFEVVHGRGRSLLALDAHFARFEHSLAQLGLPAPDLDAWRLATLRVLEDAEESDGEFALRYVVTAGARGVAPAGWIRREAASATQATRRLRPGSAATLNRGTALGESSGLPWLLHGVKSLSYGGNLLGERWAAEHGYDDAIYVTRDGYLLEGATSALLWLSDGVLRTTDYGHGVLPGTTQRVLFEAAPSLGLKTDFDALSVDALGSVEGLWLASAMRLVTAVGSVDGRALAVRMDLTAALNDALLAAMREVRI